MSITFSQETAIETLLRVDLSTVTTDRIIELCLLYRSAPTVYPEFKNNLEAEITRRFTAVEIATNDVMFSVIQNFSNQFGTKSVALNFADGVTKLLAAKDKEEWSKDNTKFYQDALLVSADWNSLIDTTARFTAICESKTAMDILLANSAFTTKAMSVDANVMTMINSSSALLSWVGSANARTVFGNTNTYFQSKKQDIYNKVSTSPKWKKQAGLIGTAFGAEFTTLSNMASSGVGFVFTALGSTVSGTTITSNVRHQSSPSVIAASGSILNPSNLANINGISFDRSVFYANGSLNTPAQTYAEIWVAA